MSDAVDPWDAANVWLIGFIIRSVPDVDFGLTAPQLPDALMPRGHVSTEIEEGLEIDGVRRASDIARGRRRYKG